MSSCNTIIKKWDIPMSTWFKLHVNYNIIVSHVDIDRSDIKQQANKQTRKKHAAIFVISKILRNGIKCYFQQWDPFIALKSLWKRAIDYSICTNQSFMSDLLIVFIPTSSVYLLRFINPLQWHTKILKNTRY